MAHDITITCRENADGGAYIAHAGGSTETGELTWRPRGPAVRIATHTGVPPALRGQGIAARLVEALVADAEAQGFTIVPACSYVEAQFRRHPEWSHLRASA
ncbi:N-acetyltransferase [Erythrobacteraceae bacterium CFH 75059]|uniref:GNAT family N-acetyltransferase n=1 Tax=Qipengyuania thermophila TaxID=2509361 RepID=UPI0010228587|nr:GNAT family N-acetyltransferase [Qipengyuania thermophila]TCD06761.1 N-acetyltransferase [Erythrobacteraceae bacterium CFH 75059]